LFRCDATPQGSARELRANRAARAFQREKIAARFTYRAGMRKSPLIQRLMKILKIIFKKARHISSVRVATPFM
jgi:hypothetical protein